MQPSLLVCRRLGARLKGLPALSLFAILGWGGCSSPSPQSDGTGGSNDSGGASHSGGSNGKSSSGGSNGSGGTIAASGGSRGSGGSSGSGGSASGGAPAGSGGSSSGSGGTGGGGSGSGGSASGGAPAGSGGASAGGSGSGGAGTGSGGSAGSAVSTHTRDHCVDGYAPDPADDNITGIGPTDYVKSNQTDTTVPPQVLAWMMANVWEEAHFQWHNIRRCKNGMVDRTRDGGLDPCTHTDLVPANQEFSGPGDGLEFLAMHRHMIQSLRQLYPKHAALFDGFPHFPTKASDVPAEWQADWTAWPSNIATAGAKADDPASHMKETGFESEGAFGQWIQGMVSGLHGALHFKWVRTNNQDHGLGNQFVNIDNYMFWKMHGWIDTVWDRYRAAQGKMPTDQDIKDAVLAQCRQMDQLALLVKPDLNPNPGTCTPAPKQSGEFVDKIRPIFESATNKCTGCHGMGASANLTLGGSDCVKSSDIVAALVNKPSTTGGQFALIVPMHPEKSWLYQKVMGTAATAGCMTTGGVTCMTDTMPQGGGGVTLTTDEQDALKTWINNGAPAPQ